MAKIKALASCQIQGCAERISHTLDHLRWYKGEPICEVCYESWVCENTDQLSNVELDWSDLPEITLKDLVV